MVPAKKSTGFLRDWLEDFTYGSRYRGGAWTETDKVCYSGLLDILNDIIEKEKNDGSKVFQRTV